MPNFTKKAIQETFITLLDERPSFHWKSLLATGEDCLGLHITCC